jgi:hypothetical protein
MSKTSLKFPHLKNRIKPKRKKGKTKDETLHLGLVASIGCIICGSPAVIHHIRT